MKYNVSLDLGSLGRAYVTQVDAYDVDFACVLACEDVAESSWTRLNGGRKVAMYAEAVDNPNDSGPVVVWFRESESTYYTG